MAVKYEDRHLHLGYYEEGYNIEGVALKVDGKDEWQVFFNFGQYGLPVPIGLMKAEVDAYAGVHVFTVTDKQANNKEVHNKFSSFVTRKVMPPLKRKSGSASMKPRRKIKVTAFAGLAILFILLIYLASNLPQSDRDSAMSLWEEKNGKGWKLEWNDQTSLPSLIYGKGIYIGEIEESNADEKARKFLEENKDVLGVDVGNLKLEKMEEDKPLYIGQGDTYALSYRQEHHGVPVFNGYVNTFISNNKIVFVDESYYADIQVSTAPSLKGEDAAMIAWEKLNAESLVTAPQLVIFPEETKNGISYHLAYMVDLPLARNPLGLWTHIIDANTGDVLYSLDKLMFAERIQGRVKGKVFLENPGIPQAEVELPHEAVFTSTQLANHAFFSGQKGIIPSLFESFFFSAMRTASPIDLSAAKSATLSFKARFDMEPDDSVSVVVGTLTAQTISLPDGSTITVNVFTAEFLKTYTGLQDAWAEESFNLTGFAGKEVLISFSFVTDDAGLGQGFFADDITVTTDNSTVFFDDAETGSSKWVLGGFSRTLDGSDSKSSATGANGDYRIEDVAGNLSLFSSLSGPFVDVNNLKQNSAEHIINAPSPDAIDWNWKDFDTSYKNEESNVFYHANIIHGYFTKGSPFDFEKLNFPMQANVELEIPAPFPPVVCNAFSTGSALFFFPAGENCESTALSADIIYHEYAHNVIAAIYSTASRLAGQVPAMNEGWADYFAATITDDPAIGEGVFKEPIRFLNNTKRVPNDMVGEPHIDSLPFSGAMWDLRSTLGKDLADSLVIRATKLQPKLFKDFLTALLTVDDDNGDLADGTPHIKEICKSFEENHRIESDLCLAA